MDIEGLTGKIADGIARYKRANTDRIGAAMDVGAALVELRERLPHGEFGPAVGRLGIPERTARDWMKLARAGYKTATVADLGGIRAALENLRQRPPGRGGETATEVRIRVMEADNAELRRKHGEYLVNASPEELEMEVTIRRDQRELRDCRSALNDAITKKDYLRREGAALRRENDAMRERLTA